MEFPRRRRSTEGRRARSESAGEPSLGWEDRRDETEDVAVPQPLARSEPAARVRRRRETLARIVWALPWIVFAIAIIVIGGLPFTLAMIGLASIALVELFRMTARARPLLPVALAAAAGMVLAAHFGDSFQIVLVGVAFFPVMFALAASREKRANVTWSMATTVFGIVWIGLPFAHAVLLRDLPDHGAALLVDVLIATFVADTAAYLGGRLFGSRPLAPSISPNKTWEGLAIGIVGGTMGFWFAGLYQDWLSGTDALVMGVVIASLAPVGDLFESMVKRDLDVKDTGHAFGPHGGVLDRLDAVLFTVVAGYYLSVAFVF